MTSRICLGLGAPISVGLRYFGYSLAHGSTNVFVILLFAAGLFAVPGIALALSGKRWDRVLALLLGALELWAIWPLFDMD